MILLPPLAAACTSGSAADAGAVHPDAAPLDGSADAGVPTDAGAIRTDAAAREDAAELDAGPADLGVPDAGPSDGGGGATFEITGRVTFDWVEAKDDYTEGGARLDYGAMEERPARRVVVQALPMISQTPVAEAVTDDDGRYRLLVPIGRTVHIRVLAESRQTANTPDGIPPDHCAGATWRTRVVDNTQRYAAYVADDRRNVGASSEVDVHAALVYRNNGYSDRTAAPFALIDTFITQLEVLCTGDPAPVLPLLHMNWSENNIADGDDVEAGEIGTSYYSRESGVSNLYLVGEAEVDTDEYDDHIVAHELGHYLEDRLYRSDSNGGSHYDDDSLDPATAFSEGYGNAISGMTFGDPIYVDTSGENQASGYSFDVSEAPSGDDRAIYSEWASQYLLWALFENRDATPRSGRYDHLHEVMRAHQRTTPAVTSAHTFVAYYNQTFGGDAEELRSLWVDGLGSPFDALCAGACSGTGDLADPFDVDNDLGREYAGAGATIGRRYPQETGQPYSEDFWRLYRTLEAGLNTATDHDQTRFGGSDEPDNKVGAVRWYRYVGTGGLTTITANNLGASSCQEDVLDMAVYERGLEVTSNFELDGCPQVTFPTAPGTDYVVIVYGFNEELPSWDMDVAVQKRGPPFTVTTSHRGDLPAGRDVEVLLTVTPRRAFEAGRIRVRGLDGVHVRPEPSIGAPARGRAGDTFGRRAVVRVEAGGYGYVVADVTLELGGRRYSYSRPFALHAAGARRRLVPMGSLATTAEGLPIEILPLTERF